MRLVRFGIINIMFYFMLVVIASSAFAIGISYTPARITITADIDPNYGMYFERGVKVENPNNFSVNATLSYGPNIYTEHPTSFLMAQNESKIIYFTIYTRDIGETKNSFGVSFAGPKEESSIMGNTIGLGTDITLRMNATEKLLPYPPEQMTLRLKNNKASGKITVANPYNKTLTVKLKSDLDATFDNPTFTLEPNQQKEVLFTISAKDSVTGNIYTTLDLGFAQTKFTSQVIVEKKSNFWLFAGIALIIIFIIALISLSKMKKKTNEQLFR